jgi:hypothetical protein
MINGKAVPTSAVLVGRATELDSDLSYLTKLAGDHSRCDMKENPPIVPERTGSTFHSFSGLVVADTPAIRRPETALGWIDVTV